MTILFYVLLRITILFITICQFYFVLLFTPKIPGASSPNIVGRKFQNVMRDLFTKLSMLLHPKMMDWYKVPKMPPA